MQREGRRRKMIIDSHCHMYGQGWVHQDWLLGLFRAGAALMGRADGVYPDARDSMATMTPILEDTTGERLVAGMDAAGVDKTCIFTLDFELASGDPGVSIEKQNSMVAEAARHFPDRLIAFFSIDPRRPDGLEMFRRAVEEWGMRGLKLHPASGYYPSDRVCYPYYERCLAYGLPVVLHTGGQPAPLKARFAQPIYVDDVAADFPDLAIIMAHVGSPCWEEALGIARMKPNVYFDFSAWQIIFDACPHEFYRMLRSVLDGIGPWRVFFGTDGPYVNLALAPDQWVKAVREPDLLTCPDIKFTKEEIETVLGRAFARLMKLD
jgi:predicted TIM-barrel fold metal-dependent hydrolase